MSCVCGLDVPHEPRFIEPDDFCPGIVAPVVAPRTESPGFGHIGYQPNQRIDVAADSPCDCEQAHRELGEANAHIEALALENARLKQATPHDALAGEDCSGFGCVRSRCENGCEVNRLRAALRSLPAASDEPKPCFKCGKPRDAHTKPFRLNADMQRIDEPVCPAPDGEVPQT